MEALLNDYRSYLKDDRKLSANTLESYHRGLMQGRIAGIDELRPVFLDAWECREKAIEITYRPEAIAAGSVHWATVPPARSVGETDGTII